MARRVSRRVRVGGIFIGGDSPISIQSMTKTDTRDVEATVKQIKALEEIGCEIVRVAVPDMEAAKTLTRIKKETNIPLVADVHFDHNLALEAIRQGVDNLRINPGNIGDEERIKKIVLSAKARGISIRIGVNAGSLDRKKYPHPTPEALINSALDHIKLFEELDFPDIVISLKASSVGMTIAAYRLMAEKVDYPFHIGITETGPPDRGSIKSAVGIGALLAEGLGDTIRVSLTADPVEEVRVGYEILKSLDLRPGIDLISCPTCGRCEINLIGLVRQIEDRLSLIPHPSSLIPLKVAVMGCVVNGPGEAREADIGLAGGKGMGLILKKGEIIKKVKEEEMLRTLLEEIEKEML